MYMPVKVRLQKVNDRMYKHGGALRVVIRSADVLMDHCGTSRLPEHAR